MTGTAIDNRLRSQPAVKKVIVFAAGGAVYVDISGMNPTHAIAEIESEGGKILRIEKNVVNGYIMGDISKKTKALLANGWEWSE